MRNLPYLWAVVLLFSYSYTFSQTAEHPHGIAARAVFHNYQWPLDNVDDLRIADFSSGFEFEYYRFLSEQFNISFPLRISNGSLVIDENGTSYKAGSVGFDALLNFKLIKEGWFRPHLFTGAGIFIEDMKEISAAIPLGLGFNFQLGHNSFLSTTMAYRLGFKEFRNNLHFGAGLRFNIAPKNKEQKEFSTTDEESDKDGDGIIDKEDLCPELAGLMEMNGCPDSDGDGIADASDHCPEIPGLKILNGCPDSDSDGLIDKEDDCPQIPGPVSNSGCPYGDMAKIDQLNATQVEMIQDKPKIEKASGETILLKSNKTNVSPQSLEENNPAYLEENNIVTSNKDTDSDGISDIEDRCPFEFGSKKNEGCPEVAIGDKEILMDAIHSIEFETASAIITKDSYTVLDGVSEVMYRNTAYNLRIDGHTDSIGSSRSNKFLSERRALSCYNYLLTKGIAPSRMTYDGYGESKPIDTNKYTKGREQNRRVEFGLFLN